MLPPVTGGRLTDRRLRSWLVRADLRLVTHHRDMLTAVLDHIGLPQPSQGLAALRLWGQTGDRPGSWIAAADPIYLEPQLDKLRLHALLPGEVPAADLRALLDHLQTTLAADGSIGFVRLGAYGYVSAKTPFPTATVPAGSIDQAEPGDYLPGGPDVARHRGLLSEIEMALHDHPVNRQRISDGRPPVNSLWLWGGGTAPEQHTRVQPPLFSGDALLSGYWVSGKGVVASWPGSITACVECSVAGFVADVPDSSEGPSSLETCLHELREALSTRRLDSLTLLFRDGVSAHVERAHALRVWRRDSTLLT